MASTLIVGLLATGVAACGDDGASTTTTEATTTSTTVVSTTAPAETTTTEAVTTTTQASFAYFEDFSSGVAGDEWSIGDVETSPSGELFLGPFNNESVSFSLNDLPEHSTVVIEFDLYIIGSWNGNDDPDLLTIELGDGSVLLLTSFSNDDSDPQAFPGTYPNDASPAKTGAAAFETLEYSRVNQSISDTTYRIRLEFEHDAATLVLSFTGGPDLSSNEVFGLDNVSVELG